MSQATNTPVVAVIGATGYTGRFVVEELVRRDVAPVAIARNAAALSEDFPSPEVTTRQATVDDTAALARGIRDAQVVINCAGPFANTAHPVAAAAVQARIPYVDVCAEQAPVKATLDFFDEPARQADVAVIPGMAFMGGLGDLLTKAALRDWDTADSGDIMLGLDSWRPTPGTRHTAGKIGNLVVTHGQLVPAPASARKQWSFEKPFGEQTMVEVPFSEIILISRHVRATEIHNYVSQVAVDDVSDPATPAPEAVDERGRSAQRFIIEAVVTRDGEQRTATASGQDAYSISAELACEAAQRLLQRQDIPAGAHAPGELFEPADFLTPLNLDSFSTT
jgi:short subunit dehydrogenase-like uncharacterized protein